ncbi:MAG: response regulator [Syntrophorhabdales bacterium]|jgi:CheY-like chemotaxis protein
MGPDVSLRVLVVDNDEPVCTATSEMLESLGYRADCETDSLNALKVFSENPDEFDLAIIEPVLPDLMGLDLAIRFRHIRPGFPILFYAGYVDASLSRRIEADRFGHVALKPFRLNELAETVKDRPSPGPE